ncbi:MAG: N-acetylmuramoyl-L-alanine amidase [Rhodospirillales bacterium]|nr:N-acetylmuramoyl-L-alanine amidase [Rhodospirillales bacterium]
MGLKSLKLLVSIFAALILGLLAAPAFAKPAAQGLRVAEHEQRTRLVLDLSAKAAFATTVQADPPKVVVDFGDIDWAVPPAAFRRPTGLIRKVQFEPPARLILETARPAQVSKVFLIEPNEQFGWRFVIDLVAADASPPPPAASPAAKAKSAPTQAAPTQTPPPPAAAKTAPAPAPLTDRKPPAKKPVIAIDPGHGGADPGAIGASGAYEKNITLAMARDLKDKLEAQGRYTVVLTRDRDVFLRLRERSAKARAAGADLFISLHADALPNPAIQGLSVYTLSETASDSEAQLLAEKENKADLIAGIDLSHEAPEVANILIDLAQRETMNLSAVFAAGAVEELGRQVRLLSNSHRFAGFAVLKAPDVPSVLIEMGYLSNAQEERLLRGHDYRAKLATGLARAIDRYFEARRKTGAR